MTEPAFTRRDASTLDHLLAMAGGAGWSGLEDRQEARGPVPLQPADEVAKFMAALAGTREGRAMFDWLVGEIIFRAPFRATGSTFEETALLAATRQGIEGVGETILAAIRHGQALIDQNQTQGAD